MELKTAEKRLKSQHKMSKMKPSIRNKKKHCFI